MRLGHRVRFRYIAEGDVEIVLTLAIGATGWPLSSDYPSRYPLDHVDVILSYQSVQMVSHLEGGKSWKRI